MRAKIIETFWLFWAFHFRGINDAILGSTLLDLELLLKADLSSMSYIFLTNGLGAVGGSAICARLAAKYSLHLQLGMNLLVGCAITIAIPQVPHLLYVYIMVLLFGVTRGAVQCHVIQACSVLWTEKGAPFQFVIMGASAGSIMVPFLSQPFLASRTQKSNNSLPNATLLNDLDDIFVSNGSMMNSFVAYDYTPDIMYGPTRVQLAYIILGIFILPSGLVQFYYWWGRRFEDSSSAPYAHMADEKDSRLMSSILVVLLMVMFLLIGASTTFQLSILPVYGVRSGLRMPKRTAIAMVSVISFCSLGTRLLSSIATVKFITNRTLLKISLLGEVLGGLFLVLSATFNNEASLWIATAMLGGFAGPLSGASFARISEFLQLKESIISFCYVSASVGITVFPFLGVMMFSGYGPVAYVYVNLTIVAGHCLMIFLIEIFGRMHTNIGDIRS